MVIILEALFIKKKKENNTLICIKFLLL